MALGGGRHSGRIATEPPPRIRAADHDLIAAALAAESALNPAWRFAVVLRTCRPVRLHINGGVDYDLFPDRRAAKKVLEGDWSPAFSEPELWELGGDGWRRAS